MTLRSNSAAARDVAHHLHPFTNAARHEADGPLVMSGGHGIHVRDSQGRDSGHDEDQGSHGSTVLPTREALQPRAAA